MTGRKHGQYDIPSRDYLCFSFVRLDLTSVVKQGEIFSYKFTTGNFVLKFFPTILNTLSWVMFFPAANFFLGKKKKSYA